MDPHVASLLQLLTKIHTIGDQLRVSLPDDEDRANIITGLIIGAREIQSATDLYVDLLDRRAAPVPLPPRDK